MSIEAEEYLRVLALDCGVFFGSEEESGDVEVMNDLCEFQIVDFEASLFL